MYWRARTKLINFTNRNYLWAKIFVEELVKNGIHYACISAGSRSTPLTVAFATNPDIKVYSHIDERSASFFGLGMALSSKNPVVLVCTSGTASANFFPAIIEAHYSNVPLIILTADRPHELHDSGANQTIDQIKIYGSFVKWFVDVSPPESDPDPLTLRYLRTLACKAVGISKYTPCGPVHLNFPFKKPLEPVLVEKDRPIYIEEKEPSLLMIKTPNNPYTYIEKGVLVPTKNQIAELLTLIQTSPRGLIVCGPRSSQGNFSDSIMKLSLICEYPILADGTSGIRFGKHVNEDNCYIIGAYENFLQCSSIKKSQQPQLILHFGGMPTSSALESYLESLFGIKRVAITDTEMWNDSTLKLTHYLLADPEITCNIVIEELSKIELTRNTEWLNYFQTIEKTSWNIINSLLENDTNFEGSIVKLLLELIPQNSRLFVSNSLPIRHIDQFCEPSATNIQIFANRGVSGIDGTASTALGIAAENKTKTILLTGDLAFYHDLNGLLTIKRYNVNIVIVVLNNNGGGIFRKLPISQYDPPFTDYFLTPHGLNFKGISEMYGLNYACLSSKLEFKEYFQKACNSSSSYLIEIITDSLYTDKKCKEIINSITSKI